MKKIRGRNKPYMRAMQNLRRSNAAAPHPLPKHKGTRREAKTRAIRESAAEAD